MMDDAASVQPGPPKQIVTENTYITTPEGYGEVRHECIPDLYRLRSSTAQRHPSDPTVTNGTLQAYVFKQEKVQALLKKAMADNIVGQQYDPVKGSKVIRMGRESDPHCKHNHLRPVQKAPVCAANQADCRRSLAMDQGSRL